MPEVIPFPVKKKGLSDIVERLIYIGGVLHIADAEILLACSDFHELIAFSPQIQPKPELDRLRQSRRNDRDQLSSQIR